MILKVLKLKIVFHIPISIQLQDDGEAIGTNQCMCLPKAELYTKNSTKRQFCFRLVKFVLFNSIQLEKRVSTNAEKRVTLITTFLTTYNRQPKFHHDSTKYIGGTIFVFPDKSMADVTNATALR